MDEQEKIQNENAKNTPDALKATASDDQLQEQLSECTAKNQELLEKYVRLQADIDNFKRRISKERVDWALQAQRSLLLKLLPIVDDFDRAFEQKNMQEHSMDSQDLLTGFELIHKSFKHFLTDVGLIEISQMDVFDPQLHEALAQIESPDHESNSVIEVIQKGYMLNDQVVRPAKVTVAK